MNPRAIANLKGIATILLWSFAPLFISFTREIPAFLLAGLTSAFGFVLYGLRWSHDKKSFLLAVKQPLNVWLLFALWVLGYRAFYLCGLKMAPILEANLINYLWPLLIVLFGAIADRRKLPSRVWYGAIAGLLGVCCLTSAFTGPGSGWKLGPGHLFALLAAICFATYSVATRRLKITSNDLIGVMHFLSVGTFLTMHLLFEPPVRWEQVDLLHWGAVVELGLAISLGYSWWDEAMSKGNQEQIAIGANFIPLLSTVWLVLFGQQLLTPELVAAAILIISGSYVAKRSAP